MQYAKKYWKITTNLHKFALIYGDRNIGLESASGSGRFCISKYFQQPKAGGGVVEGGSTCAALPLFLSSDQVPGRQVEALACNYPCLYDQKLNFT